MNAPAPKKKRSALNILLVLVWVPMLLAAVVGLWFSARDTPPQPRAPLEGVSVALDRETADVMVCTRVPLHGCTLRIGSNGFDDVYRSDLINPVPDCHEQSRFVARSCAPDGLDYGLAWHHCNNTWGFFGDADGHRSDPRDPHLPANQVRLECAEGIHTGTF